MNPPLAASVKDGPFELGGDTMKALEVVQVGSVEATNNPEEVFINELQKRKGLSSA